MQEQKRVFLKGKMNKDLDDRILPAGEYRDAQNIVIATSEGSDVGTVQTILGNTSMIEGITGDPIYALPDHNKDVIYVWTTQGLFQVYKNPRVIGTYAFLSIQLLSGSFLNFSASSTFQANLLENYLYWVDGVNQPRVIDVDRAYESAATNTPYYTNEDHISVAKYNPYKPMRSIRRIETTFTSASTNVITVADATGVAVGDYILNWSTYQFLGIVESISGLDLTLDRTPPASTASDELYIYQSTQTDKSDQSEYPSWEGDPDFLEDKFVRFSYRYKYDDDTYSLIAPYTQPIYKPKQGGYFGTEEINGVDITDEEKTFKSTIVKFMENAINNVEFFVPLPTNQPAVDYKIKEVEIIFTESDKGSAQIVETVPVEKITIENDYALDGTYFKYEYRSTIPYKTVTQQDYIRVSDQIPILARAQAIASNRVMYGNFDTKLDAPESINFSVGADDKSGKEEIHAEYQNHTVKQNRNYQIGIVLKDRYGRSSGVISSNYLNDVTTAVSQSTEYHAYKDSSWSPGVKNWLGDSLKVNMIDKIPATNLYAQEAGYFTITANPTFSSDGKQISISGDQTSTIDNTGYLRGKYKDYVKITSVVFSTQTSITCDGEISTEVYSFKPFLQSEQVLRAYSINNLGWYTYTVVAKQLEHDYYNVYLPDLINGTLFYDETGGGGTDHWTDTDVDQAVTFPLYSDNINKVPRDLEEVGPDQEQYRSSSILLSGRVTNTYDGVSTLGNAQYYPGRTTHEINRIGTLKELFANTEVDANYTTNLSQAQKVKNANSNPLIAIGEISNSPIGVELEYLDETDVNLAVYETEPIKSRLEIYYETSTTGLISDINNLVENSSTGPVRITDVTASLNENQDLATPFVISNQFQVENVQGADVTPSAYGIRSVVDQEGTVVEGDLFDLVLTGQDFSIRAKQDAEFEYTLQSPIVNTYTVNMFFEHNGQTLEASATVTPLNAPPNRSLWVPNDTGLGGPFQIDSDPQSAGDGNFTDTVAVSEENVFYVRLHNGSIKYDGTSFMPGTDVILEADNFQVAGEEVYLTLPDDNSWATEINLPPDLGNGYQIISKNLDNAKVEPEIDDVKKVISAKVTNTDQLESTTFRHQFKDFDEVVYGGAIEGNYDESLEPSAGNVLTQEVHVWKSNEKNGDNYVYPWGGNITKRFRFTSFFYGFDSADIGKTFDVEYTIKHFVGVNFSTTQTTGFDPELNSLQTDYAFQEDVGKKGTIKGTVTVIEYTDPITSDVSIRGRFDQSYPISFTPTYDTSNSDYTTAYLRKTSNTEFIAGFEYSLNWRVKDVNGETSESETVSGTYTFTASADASPTVPNINLYFPGHTDPNPVNPGAISLTQGDATDFAEPSGSEYRFNATNSVGGDTTNQVVVTGYPNSRYETGVTGAIQGDDRFYPTDEVTPYVVRYNVPASVDPNGLTPTERTREIFIVEDTNPPEYVSVNNVKVVWDDDRAVIDGQCKASNNGKITSMQFWYKFPNFPDYQTYTQLTNADQTDVLQFFDSPKGTLGGLHTANVNEWRPYELDPNLRAWEEMQIKLIAFSDNGTTAEDEKTLYRGLGNDEL